MCHFVLSYYSVYSDECSGDDLLLDVKHDRVRGSMRFFVNTSAYESSVKHPSVCLDPYWKVYSGT